MPIVSNTESPKRYPPLGFRLGAPVPWWCAAAVLGLVLSASVLAEGVPMYPVKGAPEASEFALPDVDGSTHRLSDYRGRFVLVNFWAVWCAPCRKEMPSLDQGYKALSDRAFTTIGVHVGPSREDIVRFMGEVPVSFTILLDEDMEMSDWGVRGLPTTVLVDPGGRMIYRSVGEKDWASPQMLEFLHDVMDGYETAATKIVRGAAPRRAAGRVDGDGDGDGDGG